MKKVLSLVVSLAAIIALAACSNGETTTKKSIVTVDNKTTSVTTRTKADSSKIDAIEFAAGDQYQLVFWHIWGQQKSAVLESMVKEFENWMKDTYEVDVTITSTTQSNYTTLLDKTNKAIAANDKGSMPNIVVGYPDHFAGYLESNAIVSLDPYIDSEIWGVDRDDFLPTYMDENNQFGGITYSLPLSKSTELMVYNKSAMDALNITIPYDKPMSWDELGALWATIKAYKEQGCDFQYLINYDSTDNMFINFARQMNAKYTTANGEVLVKDQSTVEMITIIEQFLKNGWLSVPINYSDTADYGSDYMKQQKMAFTIGSSAGISYDIPTTLDPSKGVNYVFEGAIAMVPQMAAEEDAEENGYQYSVVQQGPNICILNAGDEEEDLIAWLFIKYLTTMDYYNPDNALANEAGFIPGQNNSARFAIDTNYFPVTKTAYESDLYSRFMRCGEVYIKNGYKFDNAKYNDEAFEFTNREKSNILYEQAAYVAYLQNDFLRFDPAFPAKNGFYGSATIRQNAGDCINKIAGNPNYDARLALEELYKACQISK